MFLDIVLLVVGMILLIKGADWFVGGSSRIAKAMKIPPLIIGLTLVSMGTSAPEASVGIIGALNGMNDMCIGNVVGSDIFNTLAIVGISSLIAPLAISKDMKKYDIPVMTALYAALMIFAFVVTPFKLDVPEAATMLALFAGYTAFLIVRAVKEEKKNKKLPKIKETESGWKTPMWVSIVLTFVGLAGIIFGGEMVVQGASGMAASLGMSEALVGLTIVAVGTSLPELVTSMVASFKGENDIAVGNIVGSNIFNIAFILGISSAMSAPSVDISVLFDMFVMLGSGVLLMLCAVFSKKTLRWQGAVATLLYIVYLVCIIIRN